MAAWFVTQSSRSFRLPLKFTGKPWQLHVLSFFPGCSVLLRNSLLPVPLTDRDDTFICYWQNWVFCRFNPYSAVFVTPPCAVFQNGHLQTYWNTYYCDLNCMTSGFPFIKFTLLCNIQEQGKTLVIHRITWFLKKCKL